MVEAEYPWYRGHHYGRVNKVGEGNGSDPKVMLFTFHAQVSIRGGGTWVFRDPLKIRKAKRQAKASLLRCVGRNRGARGGIECRLRRESTSLVGEGPRFSIEHRSTEPRFE